jgi:3-(3-hydroxy-phenyl)propionate hydroxylase
MTHCIVVGAGPVGACMGLALARRGFRVTLVEQSPHLPADPRAATLQPPTIDMLHALGVGPEILSRGMFAPKFQFRDRASDEVVATFDYGHLAGETAFPYALQCEQFKIADTLVNALRGEPGATVRLGTQLSGFTQSDSGVTATISHDGGTEVVQADYLIGCDGGRSLVRKTLGIAFDGFTYPERFLVLTTTHDFLQRAFEIRNYVLDPSQWCALFKVPDNGPPGLWRCVFPTAATDQASDSDCLSDDYVAGQISGLDAGLGLDDLIHRNLYAVNQRVAANFRKGRVFLAGDSAHVNNPLGGLGMNSGIHDAMNLADKLDQARHDRTRAEALFDAYDTERATLARDYVQAQTIQNKKRLEARTPEAREAALAELRASAADPARHKAWVMRASLIEGLRNVTKGIAA